MALLIAAAKMALIVATSLGYMPLLMSAWLGSLVVPSCSLLMMLFGRLILLLVVVVVVAAAFYGYSLDLFFLVLNSYFKVLKFVLKVF